MKKIINTIDKTVETIGTIVFAVILILIITNLFAQRNQYREMSKELLTISKNYESITTRCISLLYEEDKELEK